MDSGNEYGGGGGEGVLVDVILQGWREKKYNIKEMEKKARKVKVKKKLTQKRQKKRQQRLLEE
jgi:hypothetical protein